MIRSRQHAGHGDCTALLSPARRFHPPRPRSRQTDSPWPHGSTCGCPLHLLRGLGVVQLHLVSWHLLRSSGYVPRIPSCSFRKGGRHRLRRNRFGGKFALTKSCAGAAAVAAGDGLHNLASSYQFSSRTADARRGVPPCSSSPLRRPNGGSSSLAGAELNRKTHKAYRGLIPTSTDQGLSNSLSNKNLHHINKHFISHGRPLPQCFAQHMATGSRG